MITGLSRTTKLVNSRGGYVDRIAMVLVVLLTVVAGSVVARTFAARLPVSFEPESGFLSGRATAVGQSGASGGRMVQFGSGSAPILMPTTMPTATPVVRL